MTQTQTFDWVTLEDDEEVLWSGEPRIQSIIPAIIVGVPMTLFLVGPLIIIGAYLNLKNTDFLITTKGLYRKTGILSRNVKKITFDSIQDISFNQGILGNYFEYGNIQISTAGGSGIEMQFNAVNAPREVQELINREKNKSSSGKKEGGNPVLEELKKIRKVLMDIDKKL